MMKASSRMVLAAWMICLAGTGAMAAAESKTGPFRFSVEVREEYLDNRDAVPTGKESTFDTYLTPRVAVGLDLEERTLIDGHYAPSLRYRSDPSPFEKEVQLFHDFGIAVQHAPVPRIKLRARDYLYYTDQPKVEEGGVTVASQTYYLNVAELGARWQFVPLMYMDAYGRSSIKRYEDNDIAKQYDEDKFDTGMTLWRQIRPTLGAKAMVSYASYGYQDVGSMSRDFDVLVGAVGLDKSLTPKITAGVAVGMASASYSEKSFSSQTTPYVELNLKGGAAPTVRLNAAVTHSFRDSDTYPFASQEFTEFHGHAEWDARPNVTVGGLALYRLGSYDNDTAYAATPVATGDDSTILLGVDVGVKVGPSSTVRFAQRYEDVSSDVRNDFRKNTSSLALGVAF